MAVMESIKPFEIEDTIRLHAMGVKFPETLLLEVATKEVILKSPDAAGYPRKFRPRK